MTGSPGPRTLDTITLNGGRCFEAAPEWEYSRSAALNGAGGVNCTQSMSMSGPRVRCTSFDSLVVSEIRRSRAAGSSTSVASEVNRLDTRLPPSRVGPPGGSVATGTPATSGTVDALPARVEPPSERAGDHREHDVVEGHAGMRLRGPP